MEAVEAAKKKSCLYAGSFPARSERKKLAENMKKFAELVGVNPTLEMSLLLPYITKYLMELNGS